ncbi:MAG: hypothetical protein M3247_08230 [Thermoproteota archaeon]|nr:hypothetical protein [Thermoproteota archaeon]
MLVLPACASWASIDNINTTISTTEVYHTVINLANRSISTTDLRKLTRASSVFRPLDRPEGSFFFSSIVCIGEALGRSSVSPLLQSSVAAAAEFLPWWQFHIAETSALLYWNIS